MIILACLIAVFSAELLIAGWSASSLRRILFKRDESLYVDMVFAALNTLGLMTPLILVYTFGASFLIDQLAWTNHTPLLTGWAAALAYWLLMSFAEYWQHRLFHADWLWPVHRVHHSSTSMSPLVFFRVHPANLIIDPLYRTLPLALLSVNETTLAVMLGLTTLHQVLLHVNQHWTWGWFGKWVLTSPAAHRIHHSAHPEHFGKNIAPTFPALDHLFGTWYSGDIPVTNLGVTEHEYTARTLPFDLLRDVREVVVRG